MAWVTADVERHKKGLTDKRKRQWIAIANSSRKRCIADGGSEEKCDAIAIKSANAMVSKETDMSDIDNLSEAVTKRVSGKNLPASSFLVVGDTEEVGTWHLPVKDAAGKPDHRLMGGAFAALTKGYRGQRYAGPNKAEALRKLRALYKAEDMPIPGAAEMATEALAYVGELLVEVKEMLSEQGIDMCVCPECDAEVEHERGTPCSKTECPKCGAMMAPKTEEKAQETERELEAVKLAETYGGVELLSEGIAEADMQGPLTLKVKLIEPGFGNKRDNHYYPAEMLRRDAHVFIGAKMHESDHKDDKSTRTWVSTIRGILGFSDSGAPLGEAVVHNPDFAQRARNLAEEGLLDQLECSILGDGKAKPGKVDGKKTNIVERITRGENVDWVTRAGAGGKALSISESEDKMADEEKKDVKLDEGTPTEKPKDEVLTETPPEEKPLDEKEVAGILDETSLPASAKLYLAEAEYGDEEALKEAVTKHIDYLKAVTKSGKPFGHEGGATETTMDDEEYGKRYAAIMESHGVRTLG